MKAVQHMTLFDGVRVVKFNFCMLGMKTTDGNGKEDSAKKRIKVMTNSNVVAILLHEAQCQSEHVRQRLLGNRAGPCQEYTDDFCKLICEGITRKMDIVKWKDHMKEVFNITKPFAKLMSVQHKFEELVKPTQELMSVQHEL